MYQRFVFAVLMFPLISGMVKAETQIYAELGVGATYVPEHRDGYTAGGTNLNLDYSSRTGVSVGAELGLRDVAFDGLRLAVSYEFVPLTSKLDGVTGEYLGAPIMPAREAELIKEAESATGHHSVGLANVYYDFLPEAKLRPFIGLGIGIDLSPEQGVGIVGSVAAGINYALNDKLTLGVKYRYLAGAAPPITATISPVPTDSFEGHALNTTISYGF